MGVLRRHQAKNWPTRCSTVDQVTLLWWLPIPQKPGPISIGRLNVGSRRSWRVLGSGSRRTRTASTIPLLHDVFLRMMGALFHGVIGEELSLDMHDILKWKHWK